jgi:hypothetical protein
MVHRRTPEIVPPHDLPLDDVAQRRKALPPFARGLATVDKTTGGRFCFCPCRHGMDGGGFCLSCLNGRHQNDPNVRRPAFLESILPRRF